MTADLFDHERAAQPATLFEQYHLIAARDGDTLMLRQIDHSGNEAAIALHVSQLGHLAERAGLVGVGGTAARRFRTVADKLSALARAEYYRSEIAERCGMGGDFLTELDAVCDLADEFLRDLGNADAMQMPANLDGPDEMATLSVDVEEGGAVLVSQTRLAGMGGTDACIELHPIQAAWLGAKLSRVAGRASAGEGSDDEAAR